MEEKLNLEIDEIISSVDDFHETGSRFICNPPVMDTDEDYALLATNDKYDNTRKLLIKLGYQTNSEEYDGQDGGFESWKKGNINFILTKCSKFFIRHGTATQLCKELNLLKKEDRILVFHTILYGV